MSPAEELRHLVDEANRLLEGQKRDALVDAVLSHDGLAIEIARQLNTDTLRELLAEREAEEAKREAM